MITLSYTSLFHHFDCAIIDLWRHKIVLNTTKFKESYERTLKLIKPLEILWLVFTRVRTRVVFMTRVQSCSDSCSVVFVLVCCLWLVFSRVLTGVHSCSYSCGVYDSCSVVFWLVFTRVRTRVVFMTCVQSCSDSCCVLWLVFTRVRTRVVFMTRVQSCSYSCSVVFGLVLSFTVDPDEPFKTSLLPQFYRKVAEDRFRFTM